jgi:hypothetical protein
VLRVTSSARRNLAGGRPDQLADSAAHVRLVREAGCTERFAVLVTRKDFVWRMVRTSHGAVRTAGVRGCVMESGRRILSSLA